MRILQVSSARSFGGGERHLADLSRGLVVRGHKLFFALSGGSPLLAELDFVPQENLFTLAPRNALDIGGALRLARVAREKKVDVIHAHVARDYLPAAFATRRARAARLVVTRHVLFPLSRIHRRSLSNVSRVIAVSGAVERALREQDIFDQKKIRVVANGVDVARFAGARCESEQARREFERARREPGRDATGKTFRVGIVGELSEVKGQEVFVRAASLVYEKFGASVEFVIAGEDDANAGRYRARVERLITELGLESRVHLKGRCDDVARMLASLDVFVSASRTESFGMAMAEALACGVPVVATATEGAREVVEDGSTGLIVPIGDAAAIAAAVVSLLEDEARRLAFAARASSSARERFALERMVEETERVYAEAVGR
ncbi:MAG TPA: glycosyltransferase [Pyrinomonadaceae bacterium]|nr:glycosyltransferase [Pyrinomonadaceae bacterium]